MTRTVLFAPETFNLAEVTRGIEVARRMPDDVRCVFSGFSERYADVVREAGFVFHRLDPLLTDAQADQLLAFDQGRSVSHPFTDEVLSVRVESERALIRDISADVVVIGSTMSQFISARAEGVPLVFIKPFAYSVAHVRQMEATGMLPRHRQGAGRARQIDRAIATVARTVLPKVPTGPLSFPRVAKANGVKLPLTVLDAMDADLNLITTAPHLMPDVGPLPDSYQVVGPIMASLSGSMPPIVAGIAARPEPLVYFAVGSSGNRGLVQSVLAGLGKARCQVVAPVRQYLTSSDEAELADNIHVTDWIPAHRLGAAVDLAITHGGEGTVQNSCVQGWPFIGIPLQFEQRFNVQQCVDFGSAGLVTARQAKRADWPGLVERALRDTRLRERAALMAQQLRNLDGPGAAAEAIATRYLRG